MGRHHLLIVQTQWFSKFPEYVFANHHDRDNPRLRCALAFPNICRA
jgi:hypothetical protein